MESKTRSHCGTEPKHQFYTNEEIYRMIQAAESNGMKKGYKKGIEEGYRQGIKQGIKQAEEKFKEYLKRQQKEKEEKEKEEKKERIKYALDLGGFLLLSFFMIWIIAGVYSILADINSQFNIVWFLGVAVCAIKPVWSIITSSKNMENDTHREKGILHALWFGFGEFWKCIRKNDISTLLCVVFIWLLFGGIIGQLHLIPCVKTAVVSGGMSFGEAFKEYNGLKKLQEESNENKDNESESEKQTDQADKLRETNLPLGVSAVQAKEEALEEADVDELSRVAISNNELERILSLNPEEHDLVFFSGGDYFIDDWGDQNNINTIVLRMVENVRKENKVNTLVNNEMRSENGTAIKDVSFTNIQDEIAGLSEAETTIGSFSEIERIKTRRQEIYKQYYQQGLANLIANGEHKQALVLLYYGGQQETVQYHYAQTILWNIEFLRYKDTYADTVKERLNFIAMRYKDIACVCTACGEGDKASKLQTAFEYAADHIEE